MSRDADLTVPDGWEETAFERGVYGPDDREGFAATLECDGATVAVAPVRYRRADGEQRIRSLADDWTEERGDPAVPFGDVAPTTAFAVRLAYRPHARERRDVACVAAEAGDALAVGVWLAAAAGDPGDLRRHLQRHAGAVAASRGRPVVSDADVLRAVFADEPRNCVISGKQTRSHRIAVPYRYAPLLDDDRLSDGGRVRFPPTVGRLAGAVSHAAWEAEDLEGVAFDAPLERVEAGRYRFEEDVAGVLARAEVEAFALEGLEESA